MIPLINVLMESASKLLAWVDEGSHSQVRHLKCLGKSVCLPLEHVETSLDHVFLKLLLDDLDLRGCLIVGLQCWALFRLFH